MSGAGARSVGATVRRVVVLGVAVALFVTLSSGGRASAAWSGPWFLHEGQVNRLDAVACPSVSECIASDEIGDEVTFDPSAPAHWSSFELDAGRQFSVSCPSTALCVGVDGRGIEVTFDPKSPARTRSAPVDPGNGPTAVTCPSAEQCTAVDSSGREVTFDPAKPAGLRPVSLATSILTAVQCPSLTQCTAVASGRSPGGELVSSPELVTFDPTSPARQVDITSPDMLIEELSCPSVGECVAAGAGPCAVPVFCEDGATLTVDPTSNAVAQPVPRSQYDYVSIACPSRAQCTAMDFSGQAVTFDPFSTGLEAERRIDNGGDWPKGTNASEVACPSTASCTLVSRVYGGFEMTFNPLTLNARAVPIDNGAPTSAVACPSADNCVTVARVVNPYAPSPNGYWTKFDPRTGVDRQGSTFLFGSPAAIACPSSRQCTVVTKTDADCSQCYVGQGGTELTFDPRKPVGAVTMPPRIDHASLTSVACPSLAQCTAVDARGREITFDPQLPRRRRGHQIDATKLSAVTCPATSECVAVNRSGLELTFNPQAPTTVTRYRIDGNRRLAGVSCPAGTQCTAIDADGREITFNPLSPQLHRGRRIGAEPLTSVACASPTRCVVTDQTGNVIGGDPRSRGRWEIHPLKAAQALLDVACDPAGRCVAVDAGGRAYVSGS